MAGQEKSRRQKGWEVLNKVEAERRTKIKQRLERRREARKKVVSERGGRLKVCVRLEIK